MIELDINEKKLAEELMEMARLVSGKSYKEILHLFALKSAFISGADRVCIIIENLRKELVIKAGFPFDAHTIDLKIIPEFGEKFMREVIENRKMVWINNPACDLRTAYLRDLAKNQNITSILFMSLYSGNESLGLIAFDFVVGRKISKESIRRIKNLADLVSVTMISEYERRKKETGLRHAEKLSALGENAARVAHSLRNPISVVGGFAIRSEKEINKEKPDIEKIKDYQKTIRLEVQKLERIIRDITVFSAPIKLNIERHNLNEFLRMEFKKLVEVNRMNNHSCCKCRFKADGRLESKTIVFDRDKIFICIQDLIRNALEAKASRIIVKTKLKPKKKSVNIFFQNDGTKIDPTIAEEIFMPFVTTKTDGTGLGLTNIRSIIDAHGGSIQLENHPYLTTFKISLPY